MRKPAERKPAERKPAEQAMKRVSVGTLLEYAEDITKKRTENKDIMKDWRNGQAIRTCTVHGFYDAFLQCRGADACGSRRIQNWIADCIEAVLGETDTKTLTMGRLASRIAEALSAEDLNDEDRWALYELCFMLITQMSVRRADSLSLKEQATRRGIPDEREPHSLYQRVVSMHAGRGKTPSEKTAPGARVSLGSLLQFAEAGRGALSEKGRMNLPCLPTGVLCRWCTTAKYLTDAPIEGDILMFMRVHHRFGEMVREYSGYGWDETDTIADFAERLTWEFHRKSRRQDVSYAEMLQNYELCYEFINLMADEASGEGHVSLMVREGLDCRYDVDAKEEAEVEAAIRAFEEAEKSIN